MNSEEYLDGLIESRAHQTEQFSRTNDEVAAELAAAGILANLNKIEVPPEFARQLELHIRARARARGFVQQNGRPASPPGMRVLAPAGTRQGTRRAPERRAWISMLGIAAALLLAFAGLLSVSARSLPGDTLYGLKQAVNQFTLNFTSDPEKLVSAQIDQLRSALDDLSSVVTDGRDDAAIRLALGAVAAKTSASQQAVAALPAGPQRDSGQRALASVLASEDQVLRGLLNHVDWRIRLAFTRQLGALGDAVPTVTQVVIRLQSNGTFLITLSGTSFMPQATLVIDGQPGGTLVRVSSQQISAVVNRSALPPGEHTIGILNPDGTAAQTVLNDDDGDESQDAQGIPTGGDDRTHVGKPTPGSHDSSPNDD